MKKKLAVLGDGGWGTTVAILLAGKGYEVTLWGAFPEHIAFLKKERVNNKFLPGVAIPERVILTSDIADVSGKDMCVVAVPCKYLRKTMGFFKGGVADKLVSLTKGIEEDTLLRPSEILAEVLGKRTIAALSGPSISFEVARNLPTTVAVSSEDAAFAREVQDVFTTPSFRVYTSEDLIGVELGGALKNIIAIAAGISDGLDFGVNTKSALLTRGLAEIIRFGVKMGARKETFFGLSGLGDLATTCMSAHSRNRTLGERIGKGEKLEYILSKTEKIFEGATTTKSVHKLSEKTGVEMPIAGKIYEVLYSGKEPGACVRELMTRSPKAEAI